MGCQRFSCKAMEAKAFVRAVDGLRAFIAASPNPNVYSKSSAALLVCREAVQDDFQLDLPVSHQRAKRTLREMHLMRQVRYHKRQKKAVDEQLRKTQGQHIGGLIPIEVFVRVGLSDPSLNNRQLKRILSKDFAAPISHVYAGTVRDSFAEILKHLAQTAVERTLACAPVGPSGVSACPLFIVHIHDEATMRFRSYDRVAVEAFGSDGTGVAFSRGRYSKVQNNAMSIVFGGANKKIEWFSELQPLSKKDGPTLATALIKCVSGILGPIAAAIRRGQGKKVRCIHLLVGDGVNTNENGAKRMLHHFLVSQAAPSEVQYRLLMWKCSSHQANLVVLVAITGRLLNDALEGDDLCATLSRLYKYLIPAYLEEYTGMLRQHVVERFVLRHDVGSAEAQAQQARTAQLVALYGSAVLPPRLVSIRNGDLTKMEHVAPEGVDDRAVRKEMFECLLRLVLIVEEKPVVTRFFLFAPCCFALLRMKLLDLPVGLLGVGATKPAADTSRRIAAVQKFYTHPETPGRLRRVALCLRLTLFATSLTAKGPQGEGDSGDPPLVRLGKGEVQIRTSKLLCEILPLVPADPVLDREATLRKLLVTETHIIIRFDAYRRYPTRLWALTKQFNASGFAAEMVTFLNLPDRFLDTGYSYLLQQEAWAAGGCEADAVAFLMSSRVQEELVGILRATPSNGLEVERKHNCDKRSETTKVTGCARASRNSILQRYLTMRQRAIASSRCRAKATKSARHMNIRALAIEKNPDWLPRARGKLRWQGPVSRSDSRAIVHSGDPRALREYIDENRASLEEELQERRAQETFMKELEKDFPFSTDEWMKWMEENDQLFREFMKNATRERAKVSQRVQAMDGLAGVTRVYPMPCAEHGHSPEWSHLQDGFFCLRASPSHQVVCFVASVGHTVYAFPLTSTERSDRFDLLFQPPFYEQCRPIELLLQEAGLHVALDVFWLDICPVEFCQDRVTVRIVGAEPAVRPKGKARASPEAGQKRAPDVEEEDSPDAFQRMVERMCNQGSDCDSFCSSDDTDKSSQMSDDDALAQESEASGACQGDDEEVPVPRKAPGSNVAYSNGYFTFTDNPEFKDIKVSVVPRWCTRELMGTTEKSKTIIPSNYGDERSNPVRAMLVLRAWMLWKATKNGFCDARSSRRKLFSKETVALRNAIVGMSSSTNPSTGNAAADAMIRTYAPAIMAPAPRASA